MYLSVLRLKLIHASQRPPGAIVIQDSHPKRIFNSNCAEARLPITYLSDSQSFCPVAQNTDVLPPYSMHHFKTTVGNWKGCAKDISHDLSSW